MRRSQVVGLDALIAKRERFAVMHLDHAAYAVRQARWLESEHDPKSAQDANLILPHRSYVCAAIFFSFASLDAAINELFVDAVDGYRHHNRELSDDQVALLADEWGRVKRRSSSARYDEALELLGQPKFDERAEPFLSFDLARKVRNELVHWKPESASGSPEIAGTFSEKLEWEFRSRPFELDPFRAAGAEFFPTKLLGAGFATWVFHVCVAFMDEFFIRIGLEPPYHGRLPTVE